MSTNKFLVKKTWFSIQKNRSLTRTSKTKNRSSVLVADLKSPQTREWIFTMKKFVFYYLKYSTRLSNSIISKNINFNKDLIGWKFDWYFCFRVEMTIIRKRRLVLLSLSLFVYCVTFCLLYSLFNEVGGLILKLVTEKLIYFWNAIFRLSI